MSRVAMVTRTITGTQATVLAIDTDTVEPENKTVILSGKYEDSNKVLKAVKKQFETDTYKIVSVVDVQPFNEMYGMTEADFIAHAKKLDPETRKVLENDDAE